jgi:hypothetical protein
VPWPLSERAPAQFFDDPARIVILSESAAADESKDLYSFPHLYDLEARVEAFSRPPPRNLRAVAMLPTTSTARTVIRNHAAAHLVVATGGRPFAAISPK